MTTPTPPTPQRIELRVRLTDGTFDTTVEMPVQASHKERQSVVGAWFKLIQAALMMAQGVETRHGDG